MTEAEIGVLQLVAEGLSSKEIARRLDRSERTVNTHLVRIYRKLGVNSRVGAVREGISRGFLGSHPQRQKPSA